MLISSEVLLQFIEIAIYSNLVAFSFFFKPLDHAEMATRKFC
jgi:hypothetical protein